jgi:hypothetical protein
MIQSDWNLRARGMHLFLSPLKRGEVIRAFTAASADGSKGAST